MASRNPTTQESSSSTRRDLHEASRIAETGSNDRGRELFEACRTGDVNKVTTLVGNPWGVNMRDTAGRKSTPLHFAAG